MPLISIIIPVYNGEKTIRETVDSILNQTFTDFELIIINDGSTDSTLEIVNRIEDPRVRVFSYPNSGPQASRNRGLARAAGEYVALMDTDDLWTCDKLEAQLKVLQDNPQAGMAYSWTDYIDELSKFLRPGPHYRFTGNIYTKLLLADFIGNGSNPLIRKQAIDRVGNFDESLPGGQDWDMWLRVAEHYPVEVVPAPQILHRQSGGSWSTKTKRQEAGFNLVIEKAIARNPELLRGLKKDIIGNRYKSLIIDALAKGEGRDRALLAVRYLWIAIQNDPRLLRSRILPILLFTIATKLALPPQTARLVLNKYQSLSNIYDIFGYLRWGV